MNLWTKFTAVSLFAASAACALSFDGIRYGAYVGGGVASYNYDAQISTVVNVDIQPGSAFALGGAASLPLTAKLDLSANLLFSVRNVSFTETHFQGLPAESVNESTYKEMGFDLPVLLRYRASSGLFAQAGAQLGINSYAQFEADGDRRANKVRTNPDFGLVGGCGYHINDKWAVDARYYLGTQSIFDNDHVYDTDVLPYTVLLGVTYWLLP